MDIAFFSETYLPTPDGVAHEVSALARALQRAGHGVKVFTTHPVVGAPSERTEVDGVPVVRVRSLPVPLYPQYRWALFPFPQLRGEHLRGTDVVHLHTPGVMGGTGFLAARYYHKPMVGTFHTNVRAMRQSFRPDPFIDLFFRAAWWWTLGTYWRCDVTTAPTEAARRTLEEGARKPFSRPVEVIPNGIETDRFRPGITTPDWRERCGLPDGPLVTYLGRLTADKGVHRFLDAVALLDPADRAGAIVAGAGPEEARVRARLREDPRLSGRVRYVGPVAESEKPALLSQSDEYVLPSISDTSSVALLEAMASGTACIVSSIGGPGEMVEEGVTGMRVDPRAPADLASAMHGLIADPDRRHRMAAAAVTRVRTTASIDLAARRFITLYELVQGEAGRRAPRPA
jgi:glycosyltransferase involved in cell wall biosynthesis